jgi:hypothetical protein
MIILVPYIFLQIPFFMFVPSTLKLINTLSVKELPTNNLWLNLSLVRIRLLIGLPRHLISTMKLDEFKRNLNLCQV